MYQDMHLVLQYRNGRELIPFTAQILAFLSFRTLRLATTGCFENVYISILMNLNSMMMTGFSVLYLFSQDLFYFCLGLFWRTADVKFKL